MTHPKPPRRNHAADVANAAEEYDRQCRSLDRKTTPPKRKASIPVHSYIQGQYALKRAEVSVSAEPWDAVQEWADAHAQNQAALEQETGHADAD